MESRSNWALKALTITAVMALALSAAPQALAADAEASSLRVSQARGFLGDWTLTVEMGEDQDMILVLKIFDVDGKVAATLQSPAQTQTQVITDITESSLALKLRYAASFGETETAMVLILRQLDAGTLTGSMADELGIFKPQVSVEDELLGLGLFAARVRAVKGGKIPGRSLLDLDGNEVKITFGSLRSSSDDHKRLENTKEGEVFEFTTSRATKLFTDADLKFGDVIIKAENSGPHYPGVYSLWLKNVGGGDWSLVFNHHADVWGTMHEAQADVAEVPLKLSKAAKKQDRLSIDLEEQGDGGLLRLAWGSQEWTAKFALAR